MLWKVVRKEIIIVTSRPLSFRRTPNTFTTARGVEEGHRRGNRGHPPLSRRTAKEQHISYYGILQNGKPKIELKKKNLKQTSTTMVMLSILVMVFIVVVRTYQYGLSSTVA